MTEILVYMREAPGLPTIAEQQALLRRAGVTATDPTRDRAYADYAPKRRRKGNDLGLPERDACTRAIRRGAGDEIHVAALGVVGVSVADALAVLEAWASRGATVRVASDGTVLAPNDGPGLVRAAQQIEREAALRRTNKARVARAKRAKQTRDQQAGAWARAAELWPKVAEWTVAQIEAETGISSSTLYRAARTGQLPRRDAQPFGASLMVPRPSKAKRRKKA